MKTINFIQQVSERFFSYFIYFMCFSYNFFFYIEDIFQSFWVFHLQKRMRQLSKATSFRSKEGRELDDVGGWGEDGARSKEERWSETSV